MKPGSLAWIAHHELRLAWRDAAVMLRGGRRGRGFVALIVLVIFAIVLHGIAFVSIQPSMAALLHPEKSVLLMLTGSAFLAWMLLLSQAMETVTRAFYARADLDLVMSSPLSTRRLFGVRLAASAVSMIAMAVLLVGPAIDVMAALGSAQFLMGYGVIVAMAFFATATASALTTLLFRMCGPARARLAAQIAAAVIGAGFVVAIQICAISSYDTLSRSSMLRSPRWIALAPDIDSIVWWPAKAALGAVVPLVFILCASVAILIVAVAATAPALARGAARSDAADVERKAAVPRPAFRRRSAAQALRLKEWTLLRRDPWLISQSLMQLLYLVPPAVMLWKDYYEAGDGLLVLVPVLVMAAGQLAGGLAWLAVSGEDAHDLIATAPVATRAVLRAKIEAVAIAVAVPVLPIVVVLALTRPLFGGVALAGSLLATAGASAIQYFFRSQAKRSNFRRRQTSSRFATFAEAFLSIALAAASGFAAAQAWLIASVLVVMALGILVVVRLTVGSRPPEMRVA